MWTKPIFYAVAKGRRTGIFVSWNDCLLQVNKYPGAIFKKFFDYFDARDFINSYDNGTIPEHDTIDQPKDTTENIVSHGYLLPRKNTPTTRTNNIVFETDLERESRLAEENWRLQNAVYIGGPNANRRVRLVGNHGRTRGKSTKGRYSRRR